MYHSKNSNNRIRLGKDLFVWGLILIVTTAIAFGDIEQGQIETEANENIEAVNVDAQGGEGDVDQKEVVAEENDVSSGKVDTSARIRLFELEEDFGVRKALAMLGGLCQKNIVPTPNVDGTLAFRRLTNVSFEEAMDAILGSNFKYEQDGNLIKVYTKEETFLCMATLPGELADADIVRQIVHAKWGVENNAIKDLKDNWYMEHNFHHHPNATFALLLIMFMAHNLFYAYVFRHMKSYRLYQPTMKRISEDFMSSFLHWKWRMSWVWFDNKT